MIFFFFFQAEDGIRDYKVTGVQTCALPISGGKDSVVRRIADWAFYLGLIALAAAVIQPLALPPQGRPDRKSVVEGKRGDLGGRRIIKKKKKKKKETMKVVKSSRRQRTV